VRLIAEELNMNRDILGQIIAEDVRIRKISAKMVPQIFIDDQKQRRLHISHDLLHTAEMSDMVITGDKT
jgi:hypothetical protein